jgi:hypothetical protein
MNDYYLKIDDAERLLLQRLGVMLIVARINRMAWSILDLCPVSRDGDDKALTADAKR